MRPLFRRPPPSFARASLSALEELDLTLPDPAKHPLSRGYHVPQAPHRCAHPRSGDHCSAARFYALPQHEEAARTVWRSLHSYQKAALALDSLTMQLHFATLLHAAALLPAALEEHSKARSLVLLLRADAHALEDPTNESYEEALFALRFVEESLAEAFSLFAASAEAARDALLAKEELTRLAASSIRLSSFLPQNAPAAGEAAAFSSLALGSP